MLRHIKRWNEWRKHNTNGRLHHLLVLFKIAESPTFNLCLTKEEVEEFRKAFERGMKGEKYDERIHKN